MPDTSIDAEHVWAGRGFGGPLRLSVEDGSVSATTPMSSAPGVGSPCWVVPGVPNLHSHAFQRAMTGLAEHRHVALTSGHASREAEDSFWSWRETMYAFAGRIGPEELRAIAAQLYVEMLKAGYTRVCEFHYLHHQPDGTPYADTAAMSLALIEAARETGIGLTLLPVLYMTGGFDGRELTSRQRRFGHAVDDYLRLLERLGALQSPMLRIGIALHSLRAVPADAMRVVLESGVAGDCPIHIHIAEQVGEVQDCLAMRDARPVEWLLDHADVDPRWCLVHATHMTADETRRLAATGAVAGLCPTTEANLGDGLFPLKAYLDAGGVIGVGSDSQISVSPVEELRWLEYGQRLVTRHRNVVATADTPSSGEVLYSAALRGGARASGLRDTGEREASGRSADFLVLDEASPILAGRGRRNLIDSWIFAGNSCLVRDVMVAGEWVVRSGRHHDEERIATEYRAVVERLAKAP